MKSWLLAALVFLQIFCLFLPLSASDDRDRQICNSEHRLAVLETEKKGGCVINPPARPYPAQCWGFYISVDPLFWQAHVNGLDIGIETTTSSDFFSGGVNHVRNLNWDWNFGFRLGLGLNTTHDAWDVLLQWTYWKSTASRNFSLTSPETFFQRIGAPGQTMGQNPQRVEAKWQIHLNMLDLENGRDFYVSPCLSFRPFAGLRAAWIQQTFNTGFKEQINPALPPNNQLDVDQRCRYFGLGIRGGLDSQWNLIDAISLFANYSGSLLYNYYSVRHNEAASINGQNKTPLLQERDFYHAGSAILDMQMGIRYSWISCDCCYHLGIEVGWEHHYFPGQNQFLFFADKEMVGKFFVNQGDLATQGFFAKMRFDF